MTRLVPLLALIALAVPAVASAHATLLTTRPTNGAVLQTAPKQVRATFDDTVRVGTGNAVVANATGASVLDGAPFAVGRTLVLPLRASLQRGSYSVRWSIVSEDGHRERGVLAFAIGAGSALPQSILGASAPLQWKDVVFRTLFFLGILGAAGASTFGVLARRILGERLHRPLALLLFVCFFVAFVGASAMNSSAPTGTRFSWVIRTAIVVTIVGAATSALSPLLTPLLVLAGACSLAVLVTPALAGHALDRSQPRVLAAAVDVAHLAGAAVWLGGLLSLLYVLPRAADDDRTRRRMIDRFSAAALVAVVVLAASGAGRALTELTAAHQIWSTSYGRALIVKTALFVPLLGVAWLNRVVLANTFARLRRSVLVEILVIAVIVGVVGVLTELQPGGATSRVASAVAAPLQAAAPPALPPRNAVVDARELGTLAVAVARSPGTATITLVDSDGTGAQGFGVRVDGRPARACGAGCYRAAAPAGLLRVSIAGRTLVFTLPERAAGAQALLAELTRVYRSRHTIVFDERLASGPANAQVTRFEVVAPHRLAYQTHDGLAAVVIGSRRWDRASAAAPWLESAQSPIDVTEPYWREPTNVHLVGPHTLTFLDRTIPAWFRLTVAPGGKAPTQLHMVAAAHFMVDSYSRFDGPVDISPPVR